jgi:hypothetical protein
MKRSWNGGKGKITFLPVWIITILLGSDICNIERSQTLSDPFVKLSDIERKPFCQT